jgi:hypothetical protein
MKQLLIRLKILIKSKRLNVFVLFLSIAFFILIITKLSQNYTNTISFKIETVNVPVEVVLLNQNKTLDVSFKADGFKWLSYVFNSPKIKIDFEKDSLVKTANYLFRIKDNKKKLNSYLPKTAESILYNTEELIFKFDVNYTKNVPVKLIQDIQFANGFDSVDSIRISPKYVKLIGPKSILDTIAFVSTKMVKLKNVNSSKNIMVNLDLKKFDSAIDTNISKVKLSLEVDKFTEGTFLIPLQLINTPKTEKVTYFPKNATVIYYTTLSDFSFIKKTDFKLIIDYDTVNKTTDYLVPKLEFNNPRVKTARVNLKKVDYIVTE